MNPRKENVTSEQESYLELLDIVLENSELGVAESERMQAVLNLLIDSSDATVEDQLATWLRDAI
jgi:hypothetical protein